MDRSFIWWELKEHYIRQGSQCPTARWMGSRSKFHSMGMADRIEVLFALETFETQDTLYEMGDQISMARRWGLMWPSPYNLLKSVQTDREASIVSARVLLSFLAVH